MKSHHHKGAVTAIHCLQDQNLILIGHGAHLDLVDLQTNAICDTLLTFYDTTHCLHGVRQVITPDGAADKKFLIFGGKSLRTVAVNLDTRTITDCHENHEFKDWILDVSCCLGHIYAVSAHNNLFQLSQDFQQESILPCKDEKCILYSARIIQDSDDDQVIIMGGTVFRQVIIWAGSGPNVGQVYHRLVGHEGVIFSVEYKRKKYVE